VMQLSSFPYIRDLGISPLIVGIVCGMLYGNFLRGTMPTDWSAGVNFTARRLLRIAVAFYGLNISIQQIIAVGMRQQIARRRRAGTQTQLARLQPLPSVT